MKIKLSNVFELFFSAANTISVAGKLLTQKMPLQSAFDIKNELQKLDAIAANLGDRHGEVIKSISDNNIADEEKRKIALEFDALMKSEVDVDIKKIDISKCGNIELTPQEARICEFLFNSDKK